MIQNAMDVGAVDTAPLAAVGVACAGELVRDAGQSRAALALAHMDLIPLKGLMGQGRKSPFHGGEGPIDPGAGLFLGEHGSNGQQAHAPEGAALLHAQGVRKLLPQHLVAAADAQHRPVGVSEA